MTTPFSCLANRSTVAVTPLRSISLATVSSGDRAAGALTQVRVLWLFVKGTAIHFSVHSESSRSRVRSTNWRPPSGPISVLSGIAPYAPPATDESHGSRHTPYAATVFCWVRTARRSVPATFVDRLTAALIHQFLPVDSVLLAGIKS